MTGRVARLGLSTWRKPGVVRARETEADLAWFRGQARELLAELTDVKLEAKRLREDNEHLRQVVARLRQQTNSGGGT